MDKEEIFGDLLKRVLKEENWRIDSGSYYGSWWSDYVSPIIKFEDDITVRFKIPTKSYFNYNAVAVVTGKINESYELKLRKISSVGYLIDDMIKRIKERKKSDYQEKLYKIKSYIVEEE